MSRRPTDDIVLARIEQLQAYTTSSLNADLERIKKLFPLVRNHRLRNAGPKAVGMDCTRPESVVRIPEPAPEPQDLKAILYVLDALQRIAIARRILAERIPALDAKISGRKLEDEAPLGSRAVESTCIVCEEVFVHLKRGMCSTDYEAWRRADYPDVGMWIPQRRSYLAALPVA